MGADDGKRKARQYGAGFNHPNLVELQFFLHQGAKLLSVRDHHERQRQRFNQRRQIRVMQYIANHITKQKDHHTDNNPQPNVQPVQRGQFKVAYLLALNNGVGDTDGFFT